MRETRDDRHSQSHMQVWQALDHVIKVNHERSLDSVDGDTLVVRIRYVVFCRAPINGLLVSFVRDVVC